MKLTQGPILALLDRLVDGTKLSYGWRSWRASFEVYLRPGEKYPLPSDCETVKVYLRGRGGSSPVRKALLLGIHGLGGRSRCKTTLLSCLKVCFKHAYLRAPGTGRYYVFASDRGCAAVRDGRVCELGGDAQAMARAALSGERAARAALLDYLQDREELR